MYSNKTGITYYVEPIDERTDNKLNHFGDINPVTKQLEGDYGSKFRGSIKESESLITPDNGFVNIQTIPPGVSPHGEIERVDDIRYAEGVRPK